MLNCNRFRWVLLPLLTGAIFAGGNPVQADVVYNGNFSIGVGSIDTVPGSWRDRDPFYGSRYENRYPTQIFTNRIEDSTLINPVVIGAPIEDSVLINPVIVPSSRRTVIVTPARRTPLRDRAPSRSANMACNYFASQRPACW